VKREADEIACNNCGVICEVVHEHEVSPAFCPFCGESIVFSDFANVFENTVGLFEDDDE
jgi:uncharacterized paraquat-inducible protein A